MIVLSNCALLDDGPVRPETRKGTAVLGHYCNSNAVCAFVGLHCNNLNHNTWNGKCKILGKFFRSKDQGTITIPCRAVQTF
jgi:hypothetical protein